MTGGEEQAENGLQPWEEDALDALRLHWGGSAYEIEVSGGRWRAKRRDGLGGWIEADSPDGLAYEIADDYAAKAVQPGREADR